MTSEEAPKRLYIPRPFASGSETITAELTPIAAVSDQTAVNFVDGFPSTYSTPVSQGGHLPTRGQMNAIGNLASVNEFARACGGIVTFDQKLANRIGGYPKGAVLDYLEGLNYYKVISLVDDNVVDFTGNPIVTDTTDSDYIPNNICTTGSVDGTNWSYCEQGTVSDSTLVATLSDFGALDNATFFSETVAEDEDFPIASFVASRNGVLSFTGGCSVSEEISSSSTSVTFGIGFIIVGTTGTLGPRDDVNAKKIYERGSATYRVNSRGAGLNFTTMNVTTMSVVKGTRYNLWVINHGAAVSNSTIEVHIT